MEVREHPESLDPRRDRSLIERVVKLVDTDLALEQDELFRVRSANDSSESNRRRVVELENRQVSLNQLSFVLQQQPSQLAQAQFSHDARDAANRVIATLNALSADLESRRAVLNRRIDLYHWLAAATHRNPEPEKGASNERLIELLVNLDLSDQAGASGRCFMEMSQASGIAQVQDYRTGSTALPARSGGARLRVCSIWSRSTSRARLRLFFVRRSACRRRWRRRLGCRACRW